MNYLSQAIRLLCPSSEFSYENDDYSTIQWHILEGIAPTQAEIDAAIDQVKANESQALADKESAKTALLDRLGITAEEAALLLK